MRAQIIWLCLLLAGCEQAKPSAPSETTAASREIIRGPTPYKSRAEARAAAIAALNGDGAEAAGLQIYASARGKDGLAEQWRVIGVENGGRSMLQLTGLKLVWENSSCAKTRGAFLLRKWAKEESEDPVVTIGISPAERRAILTDALETAARATRSASKDPALDCIDFAPGG